MKFKQCVPPGLRQLIKNAWQSINPPTTKQVWLKAVQEEEAFWKNYLQTKGDVWPDDYAYRINPNSVLEEQLITSRLPSIQSNPVSILDVGAGPMTILGKTYPDRTLIITAVDPLAEVYDRLLDEVGITPPVRTRLCHGEKLVSHFKPEMFDIAYARNSLDHSYDPVTIIMNMVTLIKPGGFLCLRHSLNEAEHAEYQGLHQWNFDNQNGEMILWSRSNRYNVSAKLQERGEMTCYNEGERDIVGVFVKKHHA